MTNETGLEFGTIADGTVSINKYREPTDADRKAALEAVEKIWALLEQNNEERDAFNIIREFINRAALQTPRDGLLDPDMPDQELRLHMGELTEQEMWTARAAIHWANTRARSVIRWSDTRKTPRVPVFEGLAEAIAGGIYTSTLPVIVEAARWVAEQNKGRG